MRIREEREFEYSEEDRTVQTKVDGRKEVRKNFIEVIFKTNCTIN